MSKKYDADIESDDISNGDQDTVNGVVTQTNTLMNSSRALSNVDIINKHAHECIDICSTYHIDDGTTSTINNINGTKMNFIKIGECMGNPLIMTQGSNNMYNNNTTNCDVAVDGMYILKPCRKLYGHSKGTTTVPTTPRQIVNTLSSHGVLNNSITTPTPITSSMIQQSVSSIHEFMTLPDNEDELHYNVDKLNNMITCINIYNERIGFDVVCDYNITLPIITNLLLSLEATCKILPLL